MSKNCKKCSQDFEIYEEDLKVFEKFKVPEPTFCPDCRQQRRLAFRNEKSLYKRKCDLCSKGIVSTYSPDSPYTVYCSECFWGDKWDAAKYGRDFDFSRPFFDQFADLMKEVPLISNIVNSSVNCEYNSFCVNSKDCYLSSRLGGAEEIYYSYLALDSIGCYDCFNIYKCQYCYECVDCWDSYNCKYCRMGKSLSDCSFCYDCIGCKNCFGCVSLRNCENYFFNKKYSKEEYEKKVKEFELGNFSNLKKVQEQFKVEKAKYPVRAIYILNSQNVYGDYLTNSKDIFNGFDIENTESSRNSWGAENSKDIYDGTFIYFGENVYENISNSHSNHVLFTFIAFNSNDILYSMMCFNNCSNCFGCLSLQKKKYHILNKEYSKEEYEKMVPRIIEHMKKTGEYGEFFPAKLSAAGYNETLANLYFPLTKEQALKDGFNWKDEDQKEFKPQNYQILKSIKEVQDSILNEVLGCDLCGRNYKIIPQELKFYKDHDLSIPRRCPNCRHLKRLTSRNPRKLYDNSCGKDIKTSYPASQNAKVYCEDCYMKEVY